MYFKVKPLNLCIMGHHGWRRWLMVGAAAWLTIFGQALDAQVTGVRLDVPWAFIGLGGEVRPGTWTPMRIDARNLGAQPRAVTCRWLLHDDDGDRVVAQRAATLNPNRDEHIWLYADVPVSVSLKAKWTVQVVDSESHKLLAAQSIDVRGLEARGNWLSPQVGVIGVLGSANMGLTPYTRQYTRHEKLKILRGLSMTTLPDRWYGLSLLQALIWTADGGSPDDAGFLPAMQEAVRQWVRRGGNLVIVLPPIGQSWSGSPLADLMPVEARDMRRVQGEVPRFLYDVKPSEPVTIQMTVFDHAQRDGLTVIERTDDGDPVIVAGRYGFGRVTLVGVDLIGQVAKLNMPSGKFPVWNAIFDWQAPVLSNDYVKAEISQARMSRPSNRTPVELGMFIPGLIAMTGTASAGLAAAVIVFLIYWLAAGPVAFAVLKRRGASRYSWLVFIAMVGVFTVVTWGGAWLMEPGGAAIAHFSVLDVDGHTGEVHVHSWLSLFVPEFGTAKVALTPGDHHGRNTLASPGLFRQREDAGFMDPRTYQVDAAAPDHVTIPVRSTAKQFELDYLGPGLTGDQKGLTQKWVPPQGTLTIDPASGFPRGDLQHNLPGTLHNVLIVYCPGGGADPRPWVWRVGDWPAGKTLHVDSPVRMGAPADRLVKQRDYDKPRIWKSEGFLGRLMDSHLGQTLSGAPDPLAVRLADDQRVKLIEMLSFYDALPPPDYRSMDFAKPAASYQRSLGRSMDLSALTAGRRIILIGYMEDGPLPVPLTLDGHAVKATGWTVVRWLYDL